MTIRLLLFCCLCIAAQMLDAQPPVREELSPAFKQYLTDNNLWEVWERNRNRFDCLRQKEQTPLTLKFNKADSTAISNALPLGRPLPYEAEISPQAIVWGLQERAKTYLKNYKKDSTFLTRNRLNVLQIFERFPLELRHRRKIIVVDITASMSPYAEQVLLWQHIHLQKEGYTHFIFFNDGDDQIEDYKKIGATGGIYRAQGSIDSSVSIVTQMQRGMRAGSGGDIPENDLEALLVAQTLWDSTSQEIILIADAKSPVRDLELILQLKARVRVILCGVESIRNDKILPDYMLIAYLTGGSLHALKEDVWDLSPYIKRQVVYIGGKPYLVDNKTITPMTKSDVENHLNYKKWD